MGYLWTDLQIAAIIIVFIFLVDWAIGISKSKRVGVIIAIVLTYLTVYQHFFILVLVMFFFFGYAFFETFEKTFIPYKP